MANFCCPIEMEPRTLNHGELSQAREVAVVIVQNEEINEDSSIFTEGVKPTAEIKEVVLQRVGEDDLLKKIVIEEPKIGVTDTRCQCMSSAVLESPDLVKIKEPFTAPF